MLQRTITKLINDSIARVPAVVLLGARQVGKTTLARAISEGRDALYLDLENPEDLLKLSDPGSFLRSQGGRLVILDEIQRKPELFEVLRGVIDENRRAGRADGEFLLLGSASMLVRQGSAESLAGRIRYLNLAGLNVLEVGDGQQARQDLWLRGGFPASFLATDDGAAMEWLEDLIRTYLERDIPQLGFQIPAARLRRLWTMLAHMQGETVNYTKLARNLEVDGKTVSHYIDILADLLLVRRIEPWIGVNATKRLVKSPRCYVRDSGVLHRLLGIGSQDALLSHPIQGKSWEGFVVENIYSVLPRLAETYCYRTAAGAEIDLVIWMPNAEIWAVEIRYGAAPKLGKHFNRICEDVGAVRKYVVYGGDDEFPVGDGIRMISLPGLMRVLQA